MGWRGFRKTSASETELELLLQVIFANGSRLNVNYSTCINVCEMSKNRIKFRDKKKDFTYNELLAFLVKYFGSIICTKVLKGKKESFFKQCLLPGWVKKDDFLNETISKLHPLRSIHFVQRYFNVFIPAK